MKKIYRYFISRVYWRHSETLLQYHCKVVDEYYNEIFAELLTVEDKEAFERIMSSNKEALLYKNHDKLGKIALIKIDEQTESNIIDGTKFP